MTFYSHLLSTKLCTIFNTLVEKINQRIFSLIWNFVIIFSKNYIIRYFVVCSDECFKWNAGLEFTELQKNKLYENLTKKNFGKRILRRYMYSW